MSRAVSNIRVSRVSRWYRTIRRWANAFVTELGGLWMDQISKEWTAGFVTGVTCSCVGEVIRAWFVSSL